MVAQSTIQYSFNKGQWSKRLAARVDLAGYNSGAALLRNFFVDYRGGATIRPGSKYLLQALDSTKPVRLLPFQASTDAGYVLEFGDFTLRFYFEGAPVLEDPLTITGISAANPGVVSVVNTYSNGDVVQITDVVGMTQVNDRYFIVAGATGANFQLADLNGNLVSTAAYTAYSSGGEVRRVYTIPSPYVAEDLALVKFCQNVNVLILCHPDYQPQLLTLNAATDWTLNPIVIGATIDAPGNLATSSTLGASTWNYSYQVTSVDAFGQESAPGTVTLSNGNDQRVTAGSVTISWDAQPGAVSYNVYKAVIRQSAAVPDGAQHGFIGNTTGVSLVDSNIVADFSLCPPTSRNPFVGGSVLSVSITAGGSYTVAAPTVEFSASPTGITATGVVVLQSISTSGPVSGGGGYSVNDVLGVSGTSLRYRVASLGGGGSLGSLELTSGQASVTGTIPANPVNLVTISGGGSGGTVNITWTVIGVLLNTGGTEYITAPTVTFSAGAATGTAVLGAAGQGNPRVPAIFQQRLWLMGLVDNPQAFAASQTGAYYNYDVSNPIQDDDSIVGQLTSGQLNTIKAAVPMQAGLVVLSDRSSWLINGGSAGSAVTPSQIVANPQAYNGISDVPPIVSNYDILYVQAKGSIVRNMAYSFYTNVYTGTDISVIASDLFYGYNLTEWAWAEEPFKIVWAVRDDGKMLSLTFEKAQEFIAWAQHDTSGLFKSVCVITEMAEFGLVDALYYVVERTINGNTVKYIERAAEQYYPNGVEDAWQVDSGLHYSGAPTTSFIGAEHLAGATVTGIADGVVITPFVMPTTGFFTLPSAASEVTLGLAFTAQLKSLRLDLGSGQATVQGKAKKVPAIVVRAADTLGLYAATDFDHLVAMKDFVQGNVSSMRIGETDQLVSDLVDGDARVFLNPAWTTTGQYCIQQSQPLPASILGLIPEIVVGDTK